MVKYCEKEIPGKGFGIILEEDVDAGTIILRDTPFAAVLDSNYLSYRCSNCCIDKSDIVCSSCGVFHYCSEKCLEDHKDEHQYICDIFCKVELPDTLPDGFLFELACVALAANGKVPEMLDLEGSLKHPNYAHRTTNLNARAQMFEKMIIHTFGTSEIPRRVIGDILVKTDLNSFAVLDSRQNPVGYGLYPSASRLNHSCWPNSEYSFDGRALILRASKNLAAGDEILIAYIQNGRSTDERQEALRDEWGFDCHCSEICRCANSFVRKVFDALTGGVICTHEDCATKIPLETRDFSSWIHLFCSLLLFPSERVPDAPSTLAASLHGLPIALRTALETSQKKKTDDNSVTALNELFGICPPQSALDPVIRCVRCGKAPNASSLAGLDVAQKLIDGKIGDEEINENTVDEHDDEEEKNIVVDEDDEDGAEDFFASGKALLEGGGLDLLGKLIIECGVSPFHFGIQKASEQIIRIAEVDADGVDRVGKDLLAACHGLHLLSVAFLKSPKASTEVPKACVAYAESRLLEGEDIMHVDDAAKSLRFAWDCLTSRCKENGDNIEGQAERKLKEDIQQMADKMGANLLLKDEDV